MVSVAFSSCLDL